MMRNNGACIMMSWDVSMFLEYEEGVGELNHDRVTLFDHFEV